MEVWSGLVIVFPVHVHPANGTGNTDGMRQKVRRRLGRLGTAARFGADRLLSPIVPCLAAGRERGHPPWDGQDGMRLWFKAMCFAVRWHGLDQSDLGLITGRMSETQCCPVRPKNRHVLRMPPIDMAGQKKAYQTANVRATLLRLSRELGHLRSGCHSPIS